MKDFRLQAARRLVFLEVSEAAQYLSRGKVSAETWQKWEDTGDSMAFDEDYQRIKSALQALLMQRRDMLTYEFNPENPNYNYFPTLDEWEAKTGNRHVPNWRMAQSVAAELAAAALVAAGDDEDIVRDDSILGRRLEEGETVDDLFAEWRKSRLTSVAS